jgi:fructosamine-3-kinase
MAHPTVLAETPVTHDSVERIVRDGLGASVKVSGIETLAAPPGQLVIGVDTDGGERLVVKLRQDGDEAALEAEAHQLRHLAGKSPIRVPRVVAQGKCGDLEHGAFLILERMAGLPWERVHPTLSREEMAALEWRLGASLAVLHRESRGATFGEVLPRPAAGSPTWPEVYSRIWRDRIEQLIRTDRLDTPVLDAVAWTHANLARLLETDDAPRLVHGNLGGATIFCEEQGAGSVWSVSGWIDPALAYAHCELDIAAVELGCGVGRSFHEGYASEMPIDEGYERRKLIYMLYATLDRVRSTGATHDILAAIDLVRKVVRHYVP